MSYQPMEKLLPRASNSVYKLVRLAANRAIELAEGKPKLIRNNTSDKATTIALEEILQGKVEIKTSQSKNSSSK